MSRRARGSRRVLTRAPGHVEPAPRLGGSISRGAPGPSLWEQVAAASPAARALLPIRFFFGLTFLYAGLDKLVDPAFFNAASNSGIAAQLAAFARVSPLSPLIGLVQPLAIPIGLLIALGEIAIGLGALTGLAFRVAAAGGAAISFLFFLTASWTTHPYYYGPDLPYAFGWVALLVAGDGGLLVPGAVAELGATLAGEMPWANRATGAAGASFRPPAYLADEPSPERRLVLQAGVLGVASIAVASLSIPLRVIRGGDDGANARAANTGPSLDPGPGSPQASSGGAAGSGATASAPPATPGTAFKPSGLTVASIAQVNKAGAVGFVVPANAPSSLPAGDPALIVRLKDGSYACYDAICTHAGCRVGWDARDAVMLCPCHGAAFDPNAHAAVLGGPTNTPLLELPLVVDSKAGTITLKA
jgi:thiosulfate dehydrogenase (quinone) large subunit